MARRSRAFPAWLVAHAPLARRSRAFPAWLVASALVALVTSEAGCKGRFKPAPLDRFVEDVVLAGDVGLARVTSGLLRPLGKNPLHAPTTTQSGGARPIALRADGRGCAMLDASGVVACATSAGEDRPALFAGAVQLAAGASASCARLVSGQIACAADDGVAAILAGVGGARALSAFGTHACAVDGAGKVLCWALPAGSPAAIDGLGPMRDVAVGGEHFCALAEDAHALCWGRNREGELGDGTFEDRPMPTPVTGLERVASLSLGAHFSCARGLDATVRCWGENLRHQLANGTTAPSARPVLVSGLFEVFQLVTGEASACARMGNGDLRCWGALRVPGTDTDDLTVPTKVRW